MIKISSKYRNNQYYHAGRRVHFERIHGGLGWNADKPGFIVIIGEAEVGKELNRFVLAEASCHSFDELLSDAIKLQARLDVERYHTKFLDGTENYLDIFNHKRFSKGQPRLMHIEEPLDSNKYIHANVEMILDSVRSGNKTLHFFGESMLPAELQSLPSNTSKTKIEDYPAVTALGCVISFMDEFVKPAGYVYRENNAY